MSEGKQVLNKKIKKAGSGPLIIPYKVVNIRLITIHGYNHRATVRLPFVRKAYTLYGRLHLAFNPPRLQVSAFAKPFSPPLLRNADGPLELGNYN